MALILCKIDFYYPKNISVILNFLDFEFYRNVLWREAAMAFREKPELYQSYQ